MTDYIQTLSNEDREYQEGVMREIEGITQKGQEAIEASAFGGFMLKTIEDEQKLFPLYWSENGTLFVLDDSYFKRAKFINENKGDLGLLIEDGIGVSLGSVLALSGEDKFMIMGSGINDKPGYSAIIVNRGLNMKEDADENLWGIRDFLEDNFSGDLPEDKIVVMDKILLSLKSLPFIKFASNN